MDSTSKSWRGNIHESVENSPTIAINNRKKWGAEDRDISGNKHSDIPQKQFILKNKRNNSNCLGKYFLTSFKEVVQKESVKFHIQLFELEVKLILPMTKSKQNIYGVWVIEIYA